MTDKFIGIQLGSHNVFDEGVDHCLDLLQETAGINALFVYSHTYQGYAKNRSIGALAADHEVPVRDPSTRNLTYVWVEPHDEYYARTILRHRRSPKTEEYADRDVLAELVEPARKRGMKLFARILEGHGPQLAAVIPNWPKVLTVDLHGRIHHLPCWNNPDYRNWWLSTVEDLFKSYPLDGFKYGAERSGPLPNLLFKGTVSGCFCEHCRARGRARGIDVERARQGFQNLYELISNLLAGKSAPRDGVLVHVLRILLKYPEILAWEYQWYEAKEEVAKLMYSAIKAIKPEAQVGWHVYHQGTTWDAIYRAEMDYAEMVVYSDWLKPVVYHDIAGPRIRHWYVDRLNKTILREISKEQSLELLYDLMGYDKKVEPGLDELATSGLSPDYVYRETKRCVDAVNGKIPVYPGLGFDIPFGGEHFPGNAEKVYQAAYRAFEAGAKGLVVSREYDEMRVDNLRAIGRAVRDATAAGL